MAWDDEHVRGIGLLILTLMLTACGGSAPSSDDGRVPLTVRTTEGEVTLRVEIADTSNERAQGLSNRESLPPDAGMAFVWDRPVGVDFWMKDTLIPLQIAFWDEDLRIVALIEMEPCTADPCPTYGPDGQILGAAEANAGWFTDHGVRVGDTVELEA